MAMRSVPPAKADPAVSPSSNSAATGQPRRSLIEIIRNLQQPPPDPRRSATSKPWRRRKRWAIPALAATNGSRQHANPARAQSLGITPWPLARPISGSGRLRRPALPAALSGRAERERAGAGREPRPVGGLDRTGRRLALGRRGPVATCALLAVPRGELPGAPKS